MKNLVLGIDEAGRGPLAGPVTAACVAYPVGVELPLVTDSKKLSKKQRIRLAGQIKETALAYSVVSVGSKRIDAVNILQATRLAMKFACERVVRKLCVEAGFEVLIDGNQLIDIDWKQRCIVKGDLLEPVISAASILAKTERDELMVVLDKKYSGYQLSKHSGYPTALHKALIEEKGPCRIHRSTFAGVKGVLVKNPAETQERTPRLAT